jgi:hypothetical protein
MGRFFVLALQLVNIVQMLVNNVRAACGRRRYTGNYLVCAKISNPH